MSWTARVRVGHGHKGGLEVDPVYVGEELLDVADMLDDFRDEDDVGGPGHLAEAAVQLAPHVGPDRGGCLVVRVDAVEPGADPVEHATCKLA